MDFHGFFSGSPFEMLKAAYALCTISNHDAFVDTARKASNRRFPLIFGTPRAHHGMASYVL